MKKNPGRYVELIILIQVQLKFQLILTTNLKSIAIIALLPLTSDRTQIEVTFRWTFEYEYDFFF